MMRPLVPVSMSTVLALVALTGGTTTSAAADRATATTSETFDPSQPRMLPGNPLQGAGGGSPAVSGEIRSRRVPRPR